MQRVVEPGVFDLMVGPSSDKTSTVKLTVAGSHGETGKPVATAQIPAGSETAMVSNFDDLKVAASLWVVDRRGRHDERRQVNVHD